MKLTNPQAVVYLPGIGSADNLCPVEVQNILAGTTHLGIGAHPDDVEFMMWQGILQCFQSADSHFASVVITNGQGSSRVGTYADYSDGQMITVRLKEQSCAAEVGGYVASVSLGYTSQELRQTAKDRVCADIKEIVRCMRPRVIYTHNLADRHDSHVAALLRTLQALRELGPDYYPQEFYGCEVWRSLDWLTGSDRRICDVGEHPNLMRALMGVYDSQIAGGKSYDAANFGRRQSNATYNDAYHADNASMLELTMDLRPLLADPALSPAEYFAQMHKRFGDDVQERLLSMS
ncbi:MAG: PIG-L family deacetylase [bacterium]|nr:PIG-L family deacetylase [bacterium]